ncbi:MAG: hypothetical protein K8R74_13425 [Bacteroidales bacterium]|nr:hypothetical protein [Bacteroidales bacterium]
MKNKKSLESKTIRVIRRIARISGLILILLTLSFAIVYIFFPEQHNPKTEPEPTQIANIIAGVFILGGLGLAWKWELPGALISLAGFIGVGILNPDAMTKPMMYLFPLTAILFLICWRLGKLHSTKEENVN